MSHSSDPPETSPSLRPGLQPLVILGAPRSGTKLLRDLPGRSPSCTIIPYGLNHIWRFGLPANANDHRSTGDATAQCRETIRSSLLDLSSTHHTPATGYLVEKTCANTLRVPFVNRVLPDAQFLHIVRDGRDAAVSAREKWKRPLGVKDVTKKLRYIPLRRPSVLLWYARTLWTKFQNAGGVHEWGPHYEDMLSHVREYPLLLVCARQWKACVETCVDDLGQLSSNRVISIRYESFVRDQTILDRVIDAFDLAKPDAIRTCYQDIVHDRSVGRWRRDLSLPEQRSIQALLGPTLDRIGHPATS